MRSVLTRDDRLANGGLLTNLEFLRFAEHYGFRLRVCRPYLAQTKGKVERPIRYLRDSFLYGRTFVSDADLNAQADHWLETVANARVHGTTGVVPAVRFLAEEQGVLQPLPARPYMSLLLHPAAPCPRVRSRGAQVVVEQREPRRLRGAREGGTHDAPRSHRPVTARAPPGAARRSQDARRARGPRRHPPPL